MVSFMETFQRFYLPVLLIGIATGLLALIPKVGLILALSAFMLAYRYAQRTTFSSDLLVIILVWLLIRQLALALTLA